MLCSFVEKDLQITVLLFCIQILNNVPALIESGFVLNKRKAEQCFKAGTKGMD